MANTVDEGDQRQEEKSMGCWEMGDGRWGGGTHLAMFAVENSNRVGRKVMVALYGNREHLSRSRCCLCVFAPRAINNKSSQQLVPGCHRRSVDTKRLVLVDTSM